MNSLRRRVMVSESSALATGVYAYYSDGTLKSYAEADSSAIGVAIITNKCKFVIDKTESGDLAFSGIGRDSELVASGIVVTNDLSVAVTDFNGSSNTTKIIEVYSGYTQGAVSGAPTAEYARTRFNGLGYLGAAGEWNEALSYKSEINSMMSKIGGTQLSLRYWVSTIYPGGSGGVQWRTNFQNNSIEATYARNNTYNMRARAFRPFRLTMEYVDLGLPSGIKWATCNLGATNPEEAGLYFSWGNIVGHNNGAGYDFGTSNSGPYASTPGKNVSANIASNDATHDAALACLGSPWHLPTKENFQELYDNTDGEWTSINGINGYKFMKKTDHSVFVFFPAAGSGNGTSVNYVGSSGYYWSSSWYSADSAYYMLFNSSSVSPRYNDRYRGFSVRAVYDPSL